MEQLILHLIGDYVTQSDWMAQNKRTNMWAAAAHALIYSLPFMWLADHAHHPYIAYEVILMTHLLIDHFGLARYVVFAKNFIAPFKKVTNEHFGGWTLFGYRPEVPMWMACSKTGYSEERPIWLSVWLLIVADNTIHLAINYSALRWL